MIKILKEVNNSCRVKCYGSRSVSACRTRRTTGTEVQGTIPNSVITMVISSGGVTSYMKLSNVRPDLDCHSDNSGIDSPSSLATSLGSPV